MNLTTASALATLALLALALGGSMVGPPVGSPGDPPQASSRSHPLFTIPEHDLYPENVAYDSVSGDYFLSSMGQSRILRIHPDGTYRDFVRGLEPDLQGSVGMKVDPLRRRLWVAAGRYTLFGGDIAAPPLTGVLLFDLDAGDLLGKWLIPQPSPGHIFNDITLASDGDAYVTTTLFGRIYRVSSDSEEMEPILETPGSHNNGIVLDPTERFLFFTLDREISRLDLATREVQKVDCPESGSLGSDGIYFYDRSLVVVKPRLGQVARLYLDEALERVVRVEVLAEGEADFAYPTTGVLVGDRLVFVATSYADRPRDPAEADQHPDVLVRFLELRR